jgi:flagellar P-ring protein precursor FlgI
VRRLLAFLILLASFCAAAAQDEKLSGVAIRDLGRIDGWRHNPLVGYGLVTGLAGTGDSPRNRATRQSISNMLAQFGMYVPIAEVQSRNVAAVMVTANLPPFARAGDRIDVTVTSVGDARSLLGGALLLMPLRGPDERVRALAQGALAVGGYQYDLNGTVAQKNHPTVGAIPLGATVELGTTTEVVSPGGSLRFVLAEPDYTMASRVAAAINAGAGAGPGVATPRDAASIDIAVPEGSRDGRLVSFLTRIENLTVVPVQRARVVINERTGTVVSGGDVRISMVTISHGELKVSIVTDNFVSQPVLVRETGPGVRTVVVPNTRIQVSEAGSTALSLPGNNTVGDLVAALNRVKTSTRDVISILQGIKAAGALHAELVIQ